MIDIITGKVIEKYPTAIVVMVQGIGYRVFAPLKVISNCNENETIKLYTKLILPPEGTPKLYGFDNEGDRKLFEELLRIPKVGAKVALSTISHFSPGEISEIVESSDVKRLSSVPGLGKKLSERVILELKGRLKLQKGNLPMELVEALESLGYRRSEIFKVLSKSNVNFEKLPIEEAVKKAIGVISGGKV